MNVHQPRFLWRLEKRKEKGKKTVASIVDYTETNRCIALVLSHKHIGYLLQQENVYTSTGTGIRFPHKRYRKREEKIPRIEQGANWRTMSIHRPIYTFRWAIAALVYEWSTNLRDVRLGLFGLPFSQFFHTPRPETRVAATRMGRSRSRSRDRDRDRDRRDRSSRDRRRSRSRSRSPRRRSRSRSRSRERERKRRRRSNTRSRSPRRSRSRERCVPSIKLHGCFRKVWLCPEHTCFQR